MEFLVKGLLPRLFQIERIQKFEFQVSVHPHRDPGIYNEAEDFLRSFTEKFDYALVLLDYLGCGREERLRSEIEKDIEGRLLKSGWLDRVCVVSIMPELENWIWVNEQRVQEAISWDQASGLYDWLHKEKWKKIEESKPTQPKEAFEAALKQCNTPRSSSLYYEISSKASYRYCQDAAFHKMLNQLRDWFSV